MADLSFGDNLQFLWCALCNCHMTTLIVHHCTLVIAVLILEPGAQVALYQTDNNNANNIDPLTISTNSVL